MIAYVDESMLIGDGGFYLLAAFVHAGSHDGDHRSSLAATQDVTRRFHWHNEEVVGRHALLDTMATFDANFLVSWSALGDSRKQERSRSIALRRLLWEIQSLAVNVVVFESRQASRDRRDRITVLHAQKSGHAGPTLRYRFESARTEPLLWAADALAGAARTALGFGDHSYLDRLGKGRVLLCEARPGS